MSFGLSKKEIALFRSLNTPRKIQDFLNRLPINFERNGDTCHSPRLVLRQRNAHCMEGAMFAAAALRLRGHRPLVIDLTTVPGDFDHVVAVFKQHGCWGAISKTNHAVLRYREPVYRNIRELVMSYFHEYFLDDGRKTLRAYSMPIDLGRFDSIGWMTAERDVWEIPEYLASVPHRQILTKKQAAALRKADKIEIAAGKLVEWRGRWRRW